MSIQAVSWVLDHSQAEHSARLVLIVLANHAGGDDGDTYPSIPRIAREARLGESTVRVALADLLELGEIVEAGMSPLRTRTFRLTYRTALEAPDPPQNLDPSESGPPLRMRTSDTADSEPKPSFNRESSYVAPGTRATPAEDDHDLEQTVEHVRGVLQRGIDGLTSEEPCRAPGAGAIRAALESWPVDAQTARLIAVEVRSIAQAQNRAPNIVGLYARRLEDHVTRTVDRSERESQPALTA